MIETLVSKLGRLASRTTDTARLPRRRSGIDAGRQIWPTRVWPLNNRAKPAWAAWRQISQVWDTRIENAATWPVTRRRGSAHRSRRCALTACRKYPCIACGARNKENIGKAGHASDAQSLSFPASMAPTKERNSSIPVMTPCKMNTRTETLSERARTKLEQIERELKKSPDFQLYVIAKSRKDRARMRRVLMQIPHFRLWRLLTSQ